MHPGNKAVLSVILGIVVIMILTVMFGIVADIWLCINYGSEHSISWAILSASHEYPVIPFLTGAFVFGLSGLLGGHLFWSQRDDSFEIHYKFKEKKQQ